MPFTYNVVTLCPDGYNILSDYNSLIEELGYDEESFYESFEMTAADVAAFKNKLRYWPDLIPSDWTAQDAYVIPPDILEWNENGLLLDINDFICEGETGSYVVLTLSTEAWAIL